MEYDGYVSNFMVHSFENCIPLLYEQHYEFLGLLGCRLKDDSKTSTEIYRCMTSTIGYGDLESQLTERPLRTPEVRGLNPVISNQLL